MPLRKFRRARNGRIVVHLSAQERNVLRAVTDQIADMLGQGAPDDVRARLFPRAYDDAGKNAEYRRLMAQDLEERKAADLATVVETLGREPLELTPEEARAWMQALQDMRLTLGTLLGIEEDGWEEDAPDDPDMALLRYLGFLQDSLVRLVM